MRIEGGNGEYRSEKETGVLERKRVVKRRRV
jgi:hypothetical protein